MSLKLSVIGTGYLGAVHATAMASVGFEVIGIDSDQSKIKQLENGVAPFYICSLDSCSSLMNWGNGPTLGEMIKTETECIRMDTFIEENDIKEIEYISIDTQGSDLNVLNGFGDKFGIVKEGLCESLSEDTKWKLYDNQPLFEEFVAFFSKFGYNIDWDYNWGGACEKNEINIHFIKKYLDF